MKKHIILYNPITKGATYENAQTIQAEFPEGDEFVYQDVTQVEDLYEYLCSVEQDADVVLLGGDGTIHHAANVLAGKDLPTELYYNPRGSGNDFFTDVKGENQGNVISLNKYLKDLPTVTIDGKKTRFINGIGFGIDGYCCEEGDRQRAQGVEKINYAGIAIKGLFFHFKQRNAVINVDGKEYKINNVWLAPTMIGRYYGGGMEVAPAQNRLNENKELTLVLLHTRSKLHGLIVFPNLFKGTHVNNKKAVSVFTGKNITVTFDRPTPLQIDGETVPNVTSYTATAAE